MSEWQAIETAPKDGTAMWVGCPGSMRVAFWREGKTYEHLGSIGGGWRDFYAPFGSRADLQFAPTHWMPLPAPPEKS